MKYTQHIVGYSLNKCMEIQGDTTQSMWETLSHILGKFPSQTLFICINLGKFA